MAGSRGWPLLEVPLKPRSAGDRARMGVILAALLAEDLSLGTAPDRGGGTILQGAEEARLAAAVGRLRAGAAIEIGPPRVACREAILRRIEIDTTHEHIAGRGAALARVRMAFEPGETGFSAAIVGTAVPHSFIAAVGACAGAVMRAGLLAGFPLVDTRVTLVDGACDDTGSVEAIAYVVRAAFGQAMRTAGGLVEPVMRVEVIAPLAHAPSIAADLLARRGQILRQAIRQHDVVVEAVAPLSDLLGYGAWLHAWGASTHELRFEGYRPIAGAPGAPPSPVAPAPLA